MNKKNVLYLLLGAAVLIGVTAFVTHRMSTASTSKSLPAPASVALPAPAALPAGSVAATPASVQQSGKTTASAPATAASVNALPVTNAVDDAWITEVSQKAGGLKAYFNTLKHAEGVTKYTVKSGDNLTKIARAFDVPPGSIALVNSIDKNRIYPYAELVIAKPDWNILVDKSANVLILKAGEEPVAVYRVSTGSENSTPAGTFKVINKLEKPTWYYQGKVIPPGSPDNPLGSRWLGFDKEGYGLHGTTAPEDIGKHATLGCVRMLNEEVETLYELLPVGTTVKIVE